MDTPPAETAHLQPHSWRFEHVTAVALCQTPRNPTLEPSLRPATPHLTRPAMSDSNMISTASNSHTADISCHTGPALAAPRLLRAVVLADQASSRSLLMAILEEDPRMTVVGVAPKDPCGVLAVQRMQPDVVVLDLAGELSVALDIVERITSQGARRVVVIGAGKDAGGEAQAMAVVRAGALAVTDGPPALNSEGFEAAARGIRDVVRAAASVRLVGAATWSAPGDLPPVETFGVVAVGWSNEVADWLAPVMKALLTGCPLPVIVVPRRASDMEATARVLERLGPNEVTVVSGPALAQAGRVLVASPDAHISSSGGGWLVAPGAATPVEQGRLFASLVEQFKSRALAVLPANWQGSWLTAAEHWTSLGGTLVAATEDLRHHRADLPLGPSVATCADLTLPARLVAQHLGKNLLAGGPWCC